MDLIVGAGITGLSYAAATSNDYLVIEKEPEIGGYCRTILQDGNDVYVKVSALHEFGGKSDIRMQAANGETLSMSKDYGDTWFEVGIGTNINLSKTSHLYGDIERSFGADIQKKWQINAGVRFEF